MFFLGIDAGTTCIKAAIVSEDGKYIDTAFEDVNVIMPSEDACEIDMMKLWDSLCHILMTLKKNNLSIWKDIKGIGVTGQGDGLWAINKEGNPVRNAILWNDTRTKHLKLENREAMDEVCIQNHANPLYAGSNTHILRWIKENEPDTFRKIHKIFHCKDWLNFKLTGVVSSDYTDMTTALMDMKNKKFSQEILDAMDLSECMDKFVLPRASSEIIGSISETAGRLTGLSQGIPVIAGAIDVAAVAIGLGVIHVGDTCTIVGTTLGNQTIVKESDIDFSKGLILSHIPADSYICIMPTLSGASTIDWVKNLLYPDATYEEIERMIHHVPIGSKGIIYHPYLQGERAPFRNPFATGSFFGLKSTHKKDELMRAAFEGLVMSLYDCFESLPKTSDQVFISGGAAKNDTLCQMSADCLGKEIIRVIAKELGIKGIVSTLKVGLGLEKDYTSVKILVDQKFNPDTVRHMKYKSIFKLFKDLRYDYEKHWFERNKIKKEINEN
ncbi:MAG: carbohydrate kinase [Clostridia bacterium]|nr:carbohydrate kinase [Clostridia bacterium]